MHAWPGACTLQGCTGLYVSVLAAEPQNTAGSQDVEEAPAGGAEVAVCCLYVRV